MRCAARGVGDRTRRRGARVGHGRYTSGMVGNALGVLRERRAKVRAEVDMVAARPDMDAEREGRMVNAAERLRRLATRRKHDGNASCTSGSGR